MGKERNRVDKYKSLKKKKRKGFHGTRYSDMQANRNNETSEQSTSSEIPHGEDADKVIEKIVPLDSNLDIDFECVQTRKRRRANSNIDAGEVVPINGYKIIESSILQGILDAVSKCPNCGADKSIEMQQNNKKRKGMCERLLLMCVACKSVIKEFDTSPRVKTKGLIDINLRSVMATTSTGGGLTSLRNYNANFNFSQPVQKAPYSRYLKYLESEAISNCEKSLLRAGNKVRELVLRNNNTIAEIPISIDGSWQKRYGHNSLLGIVFAISIDTGEVLDYVVKSLFCHTCKNKKDPSAEWKNEHAAVCCINHEGSSGSMEKEGAVTMFLRSIKKHAIKYTTFVGDGDTSSFAAVTEALSKEFDDYTVVKEDCIGHIQKRMGSALRTYKNNCRGILLPDGKTVGGKGRLGDAIVDRIQTYYGYAIRNNKGERDKIVKAIWAIYYHLIIGPSYESLEQQHSFCPTDESTWCKYQKDRSSGTNTYDRKNCLPNVFRGELKDIFTRLSSQTVLGACEKGLTQNQNEALNNCVWTKCPKRVFCGMHRFTLAVCESVVKWNEGAHGRKTFLEQLNLNCGPNTMMGFKIENRNRIYHAKRKLSDIYRKRRQILRQSRKKKKGPDKSYIAGTFSTMLVPDPVVLSNELKITFCSDDDVKHFISPYVTN